MTRPSFEPVPIAIVDFQGDRVGADIATVIRNDLQNSGLFRSIAPGSFIEHEPRRQRASRAFPTGAASARPAWWSARSANVGGNIKVDFRLWDVIPASRRPGSAFTSQPNNWRRLGAHHRRRDLQARDRRGGLLRHPRRLCLGDRPAQRTASSASPSWTRTAPTTATSPTARTLASRRASRRRCRRSSTWRYGENSGRRASTCRTSIRTAASCWATSPA